MILIVGGCDKYSDDDFKESYEKYIIRADLPYPSAGGILYTLRDHKTEDVTQALREDGSWRTIKHYYTEGRPIEPMGRYR